MTEEKADDFESTEGACFSHTTLLTNWRSLNVLPLTEEKTARKSRSSKQVAKKP
jgi:hypothetical protein